MVAHLETRALVNPQECGMGRWDREKLLAGPVQKHVSRRRRVRVILTCAYGR
jgi:hypothetical protein